MESFKTLFLILLAICSICSGVHSMNTLAKVKIIQEGSETFPEIQYVETEESEYDITE